MAVYKRRWWKYIYLEFYLRIPFITIQTRLLTEAIERLAYDICRVRVEVWRWKWEFNLYKRPTEYQAERVRSEKPQRPKNWLKRKLGLV